jgi:hypothetical protein
MLLFVVTNFGGIIVFTYGNEGSNGLFDIFDK